MRASVALRKDVSVGAYVGAVFLLACGAVFAAVFMQPIIANSDPSVIGILTLTFLGIGLEIAPHKLRTGTASGSISFVVFIGAGLVFGPLWAAVVTATCVGSAQFLLRRPAIRAIFNTAQCSIAVIGGATAYWVLGGRTPPGSIASTLLPFSGFAVVFFLLNSSAVSGAIALSERRRFVEVWTGNTLNLAEYDLMASVLGLVIAFLYTRSGIAGVAALVVPILFVRHTYAVNLQLQDTNRELLDLMVKAIEARDPYTSGHSQRVAELARALAKDLRLGSKEIDHIATAALLHDVGKIYEEFAPILRKEGRLTPEEKHTMESHPVRSAELVGTISSLHGYVYKCVRHHHENFDGSGYPDRLAGMQIPIGARIIMVADTVDAMTTDRPYRKALAYSRVAEELGKHSGTQFDPAIVAVFRKAPSVRRVIESRLSSSAGFPSSGSPGTDGGKVAQLALR